MRNRATFTRANQKMGFPRNRGLKAVLCGLYIVIVEDSLDCNKEYEALNLIVWVEVQAPIRNM